MYTLGQLPGDDVSRDASTSDGAGGAHDASGGTGGSGATGGTGGSGGAAGTGGAACVPRLEPAIRKGLNLYFMVDNSVGLALQPAWFQTIDGIAAFVDDPANAGVGVGTRYFGVVCDPVQYATPAVEIAPLPGVAAAVKVFPPPFNGLGAAIAPATTGAVLHAVDVERTQPERDTDAVLITDGIFDLACGDIATTKRAVAAALVGTPSVRTHVVAIDTRFDPANLVDLTPLDEIAATGGTGSAHRIVVDGSAATSVQAALQAIRVAATPCAFKIPDGFATERTVLEWRATGSGRPLTWVQIANANGCGAQAAVYPVSNSTYLELCPVACEMFNASPDGTLQVREECP